MICLVGAIFIVDGALQAVASASFEGEMDYRVTSNALNVEVHYFVKGSKIRVESQSSRGYSAIIMDLDQHQMLMLSSQQKTYLVVSMPDKKQGGGGGGLHKTGKTAKILGYECEEWRIDNG